MMSCSIIEYYAEHERYKCGYCKKSDTSYSHGLWAHTMTVSDYQDLIDRGWRRSGKYCYKPTLDVTCCPSYTIRYTHKKVNHSVPDNPFVAGDGTYIQQIELQWRAVKRCKALEFKATKSQKKILKRINKYLAGFAQQSESDRNRKMSTSQTNEHIVENLEEGAEQFVKTKRDPKVINIKDIVDINSAELSNINKRDDAVHQGDESFTSPTSDVIPGSSNIFSAGKDAGVDLQKTPCRKAKVLRRERRLEKLRDKGIDITMLTSMNKNKEKQLEDLINELPDNVKHKLEVKLVRTTPPSPEWLATAKETHEVYVKYQMTIHGDTPEKCTEPKFRDFLVQSPLLEEYSEVGPPSGYGSFHQQYWLDGKIVAVGVIDILPKCVSSVYFFYDPEYINLTLGTYGALREIAFTRYLHSLCPELKYYYLGFYIHSCQKMRYKGNFHPSDLLCPETYKWFPIQDCLPKLDVTPYSRLDPDIDSVDENYPKPGDINYIPIIFKGSVVPYKLYKKKVSISREKTEELMDYLRLVGCKTAKKLVLVR